MEEKDVSRFIIPGDIENFVIGYFDISYFHNLYNKRNLNEDNLMKYQSMVEEYSVDTTQFSNFKLNKTLLNVLLYMRNNIKYCIIDTDFDDSFVNEQVFKYNIIDFVENNAEIINKDYRFNTNLIIPVDSFGHSVVRLTPIGLDMISIGSVTGKNVVADSLQVDIFSNISYQGFFIDNNDTIWIDIYSQNFDQIYTKEGFLGKCSNKALNFFSPLVLGNVFQIRNHKYVFEDFDIYNKTLELKRLEDSNIGINRGNYFAEMPELRTLSGYTLIFFTGSWCRPCKPVLDFLLIFYQKHPETTIINVNQERDSMAFVKYVNDYNIPWKSIYDKINSEKSLYFSTYYIYSVPQLFLINPKRRVLENRKNKDSCIDLLKEIIEKGCEAFEITDQ